MASVLKSDNAVYLDIRVKKGDSFTKSLTLYEDGSAMNLGSTYTSAKLHVKINKEDTEADAILTLTSTDSEILISDGASNITFDVIPATMNVTAGTYYYDLEVSDGTDSETLLEGKFIVTQDVTR